MSNKNNFLAKGAFYLLIGVLLIYAAMRTLDFVQNVMANSTWGYLFLFSTGVGAVIWLFVYLSFAEGFKQRAVAFAMGILDLTGELVLVYADTIYVGSKAGLVKMTEGEMNTFVLVSVIMVGINIAAGYFFKLWDLQAEQQQHAQDLTDHVMSETMRHLNTPEAKAQMVSELLPIYKAAITAKVQQEIFARSSQTQGLDAKAIGWPMRQQEQAAPLVTIPHPTADTKRAPGPVMPQQTDADTAVHLYMPGGDGERTKCGKQFPRYVTFVASEATCLDCLKKDGTLAPELRTKDEQPAASAPFPGQPSE